MTLYIQDPKSPATPFLHESILEKCQTAISGGGAFAFASSEGVKLLLRDEIFTDFLSAHSFDLIVGVDETTNVRALETLSALSREFSGLAVKVFYHDLPKTIFHPKFCWFRHEAGGFLITGSGNLTRKGLRGNWEAYTVTELRPEEVDGVEEQWTNWVRLHSERLKLPEDERVLARAALNIWRRRRTQVQHPDDVNEETIEEEDVITSDAFQQSDAVLVAEISGPQRWQQANFHVSIFRDFFGVRRGSVQRVLLYHVDDTGRLEEEESRPGISVGSDNHRFELGATRGLAYPNKTQGRPIVVFVRVATRTFLYRLLMLNDSHHPTVEAFLATNWTGPAHHMRQVVTNADGLRQSWPDSPLWQTQIDR